MAKMHVGAAGSSQKRRRGERIFSFESFCEPGHPTHFAGTFQENIRALLDQFGCREPSTREGMQCLSFQLELHRHPPISLRLFVMEEVVAMSLYRRCEHCRSAGWGSHLICNKRFHFVLPSKETTSTTIEEQIIRVEASCKKADIEAVESDSMKKLHCHLMHGVMHANGFAHLLVVNGIEVGSELVSGHQILDLWDRICSTLQLRKVSLVDVARKGTMELRLIHGVSYGEPWFARWGYRFSHGSYGITQEMYQKSLKALQSLPLCLLVPHFSTLCHELPVIVSKYQSFCGHTLITLGDLLRFMIELRHRLPQTCLMAMDYHGILKESRGCRWSAKRVKMAAQVIVGELKKSEYRWVSRQEVRDAARAYIGDTGLLDYVLKSLGNHIVGSYIVRREVNPVTKVLEYCLQEISTAFPSHEAHKRRFRHQITRVQVMKDLLCLYRNILKEQRQAINSGIFSAIPMAVRIVLDTKHLAKDYGEEELTQKSRLADVDDELIKLFCTVRVRSCVCRRDDRGDQTGRKELRPPYELVTLANNATVGELKKEAERHFSEMYLGLKKFKAEALIDIKADDSNLVLGLIESGSSIIVEGGLMDEDGGGEIYEGENDEKSTVDCFCGAKEEDGERMISCDICEVLQHSRCVGIPDSDEVPHVFLCSSCESGIVSFPAIQ